MLSVVLFASSVHGGYLYRDGTRRMSEDDGTRREGAAQLVDDGSHERNARRRQLQEAMRLTTIRKLRNLLSPREQWQAVALLGMMLFGAVLEMLGVGAIPAFVALLSDPTRAERSVLARRLMSH